MAKIKIVGGVFRLEVEGQQSQRFGELQSLIDLVNARRYKVVNPDTLPEYFRNQLWSR